MTLRDGKDAKVIGASSKTKTRRKWKVEESMKEADFRLKHKMILGVTAVGTQEVCRMEG